MDTKRAAALYKASCDDSNVSGASACYRLAKLYVRDPQKTADARRYFDRACKRKIAAACEERDKLGPP